MLTRRALIGSSLAALAVPTGAEAFDEDGEHIVVSVVEQYPGYSAPYAMRVDTITIDGEEFLGKDKYLDDFGVISADTRAGCVDLWFDSEKVAQEYMLGAFAKYTPIGHVLTSPRVPTHGGTYVRLYGKIAITFKDKNKFEFYPEDTDGLSEKPT